MHVDYYLLVRDIYPTTLWRQTVWTVILLERDINLHFSSIIYVNKQIVGRDQQCLLPLLSTWNESIFIIDPNVMLIVYLLP